MYRRNPHEPIKLTVCSYEKDARKLCDIPEVADYIRRYARAAKLRDWRSPLFLALEETSRVGRLRRDRAAASVLGRQGPHEDAGCQINGAAEREVSSRDETIAWAAAFCAAFGGEP